MSQAERPIQLRTLDRQEHVASLGETTTRFVAQNRVLTLIEAASALRCSKAHVSNIIRGKVPHLPPLPVVRIGRRVLIRDESLSEWMKALEQTPGGVR